MHHVLRTCDVDGTGSISKEEWIRTLSRLGFGARISDKEVVALFDILDADHNGEIDFDELYSKLRQGLSVELDHELQAGNVLFERAVTQKAELRKAARSGAGSNVLNGLQLRAEVVGSDPSSILAQLSQASTLNLYSAFGPWSLP